MNIECYKQDQSWIAERLSSPFLKRGALDIAIHTNYPTTRNYQQISFKLWVVKEVFVCLVDNMCPCPDDPYICVRNGSTVTRWPHLWSPLFSPIIIHHHTHHYLDPPHHHQFHPILPLPLIFSHQANWYRPTFLWASHSARGEVSREQNQIFPDGPILVPYSIWRKLYFNS